MKKNIFNTEKKSPTPLGGIDAAAKIMSLLKMDEANSLIGDIAKRDEDLAIKIRENMFLFDTLANIDNRAIQKILQKIPNDQLAIALKGSRKAIQEKFYKNMSQRAKTRLIYDIGMLGDIGASDAETAQKYITHIARKLAEAGDIILEINRQDFV
ncbi:MAG: flagellar motor switch protein FliG [Porticoccaceae bacterium]|nr:flagellar motor switch protein FliG [Porticoccaceae bacterium]|tara:strand:- start:3429 stop:3893 length:465 start_codon:yes stop_codon:yes gene_type:complete